MDIWLLVVSTDLLLYSILFGGFCYDLKVTFGLFEIYDPY